MSITCIVKTLFYMYRACQLCTFIEVSTRVLKLIALANPKSQSLTMPDLPRRMF